MSCSSTPPAVSSHPAASRDARSSRWRRPRPLDRRAFAIEGPGDLIGGQIDRLHPAVSGHIEHLEWQADGDARHFGTGHLARRQLVRDAFEKTVVLVGVEHDDAGLIVRAVVARCRDINQVPDRRDIRGSLASLRADVGRGRNRDDRAGRRQHRRSECFHHSSLPFLATPRPYCVPDVRLIVTRAILPTPLSASQRFPFLSMSMLRTVPPPPGTGQVRNFFVSGLNRTSMFF